MKGEIQVTDGDGNHAPEPARSPVDDALDLIDQALDDRPHSHTAPWNEAKRALATVREALERLREERPRRVTVTIDAEVATQAALMAAEAEAERLREAMENGDRLLSQAGRQLEAADAEVRRLTEWLMHFAGHIPAGSPTDGSWENPGPEGLIEEHRPAPGFGPDGGGERMLVSVNHAWNPTDIVGRSAICPDCGNALIIATVPPDGGGS